jgi:hypothetical protein
VLAKQHYTGNSHEPECELTCNMNQAHTEQPHPRPHRPARDYVPWLLISCDVLPPRGNNIDPAPWLVCGFLWHHKEFIFQVQLPKQEDKVIAQWTLVTISKHTFVCQRVSSLALRDMASSGPVRNKPLLAHLSVTCLSTSISRREIIAQRKRANR